MKAAIIMAALLFLALSHPEEVRAWAGRQADAVPLLHAVSAALANGGGLDRR